MGSNPIPSAIEKRIRGVSADFFVPFGGCMTIAGRDMDVVSIIRKILGLTIGAIIYSAGLNLFLIPNHIIDGGITGISLLVQALTGVPFSLLIVVLNLPFFYLGYRRLGAGLAVSSTYAIVVLSLFPLSLRK